ncbi:MAG: adenosine deaminase [Candidatus Eisenbacteria bacterium]
MNQPDSPSAPGERTAPGASSSDCFRRMPKVELHLHLEGAIPLPCLWDLMGKYGGDPAVPDLAALARRFRFRDFPHFIATWAWKNRFLREYEDFTRIAAAVAEDLASQNVLYAEAFYSPQSFGERGLEPQGITAAVRRGLDREPAVDIALIADLVRDRDPREGQRTVDALAEVRAVCRVAGIGLGGSEHLFPPQLFAPIFEHARQLGFRTTAHAGEACGPESVWEALRSLRVDRLGHATRAIEDPALVDFLAQERIPLELCVISNLRTGVIPSPELHPARTYFERGIPLSINTDDPTLFNNSLAEEYSLLRDRLGFNQPDIHELIDQAAQSSWLPDNRREALRKRLREDRGGPAAGEGGSTDKGKRTA